MKNTKDRKKLINKALNNNKGQVILFVIVSMTLAMAIGVTIASRTLSSLSRTSRSDSSNKALAAAESGAEVYLAKDFNELSTLANGDPIPPVEFYDEVSNVNTQADITIEEFTSNTSNDVYQFTLGQGYIKEVTFKGSSFSGNTTFCWDNNNAAISYLIYNFSTIREKGVVAPSPSGSNNSEISNEKNATSNGSYGGGCYTVNIQSGDYGLRLRTLYSDATISITNASNLPVQGYRITSIGKLFEEGKITTTKKVVVYKSKPYFPSIFDAAIYTEQDFN